MAKVYFPSLGAVQYVGENPRRFVEYGGGEVSILHKNDIVVLPRHYAALMKRKKDFVEYALSDMASGHEPEPIVTNPVEKNDNLPFGGLAPMEDKIGGDKPLDEESGMHLPFADEIEAYARKDMIPIAKYVGIKDADQKNATALKKELQLYLPRREADEGQ